MTDDDRLKHLEAENSRLRIIAERSGVRSLPHPDMPDAGELVRLHSLVVTKYPQLACAQDQFERALFTLCFARRQSKLNAAFFPTFWLDACRAFLQRHGYPGNISLSAFTAACIASGIAFSRMDRFPFDVEFGLVAGDLPKPIAAWRSVLNNGLPKPTPLNRPRQPDERRMVLPVAAEPGVKFNGS